MTPTKEQFAERWKHVIAGMILDGAVHRRTGAEMSIWLEGIMGKLDTFLGKMHEDLIPPKPVEVKPDTKQPNGNLARK